MINMKAIVEDAKEELLHQAQEVILSGRYILGPKVQELEQKIARYHGLGYAVGVASGTDALMLALRAADIGPSDEVITTAFTFFATVEAILYVGARPVFVDIDPETYNINPDLIEQAITDRTKAILPVHLYGLPAPMDRIMQIAQKHSLVVIEDCAQAFGASINGKKVGSFGLAGCYSFYPSKNLGGFGDGGMVVTSSEDMARRIRSLRNHASEAGYLHKGIGYNSRLDELQAALLLVRLKRIDRDNALRAEKARYYTERLSSLVQCPTVPEGYTHVFHQYTIRHPERDRLREALRQEGIASVVYYPVPLHLQEPLKELNYREGSLPETERAAREVLSLPMHPFLTTTEQGRVCETIERVLS